MKMAHVAVDRLLAVLQFVVGLVPMRAAKGVKLPNCGWIPVEGKDLMRRRIDEEWQYRAMTDEERLTFTRGPRG